MGDKDETNFINVYLCYYKKENNIESRKSILFDKSDTNNKMNNYLESLYNELYKYNISSDSDKDTLYSINDNVDTNSFDDTYLLYIDNEPVYISKYIVTILKYLATQNWGNMEWDIIKIT